MRTGGALAIAAGKLLPVRLVLADARAVPVAGASQDAVVASLFFHHLDDAGKATALDEIRRVLRPEGRLLIADWDVPRGWPASLGFGVVRWLDGVTNTRPHQPASRG